MQAWHNSKKTKQHYLAIAKRHEKKGDFAQGLYWGSTSGKGVNLSCWCDEPGQGYPALAAAMGLPPELLHFAEGLFEALPEDRFAAWPARFVSAIRPGADLRHTWCKFLHWVMVGEEWGLVRFMETPETVAAVNAMAHLYEKASRGEGVGIPALTAATQTAWKAWSRLAEWGTWKEKLTPDARAARACWTIWDCWVSQPGRAAWAARAARSGLDRYSLAQEETMLALLESAPLEKTASPKRKLARK